MSQNRRNTSLTQPDRKKGRSRAKSNSDEDDSEDENCTQFLKQKEDSIKDCLVFLLAHNSTLLPVKKNDIIRRIGVKLGRKERKAILETIKAKLKTIGALLANVDGSNFIIVNLLDRNEFIKDERTPDRELLCLILTFIVLNKGSITKSELENCLNELGVSNGEDPYFGNIAKSILLFEKQCYLKRSFFDSEKKTIGYEWGVRANYEVDEESITKCITSLIPNGNGLVSQLNFTMISRPEDEAVLDIEP